MKVNALIGDRAFYKRALAIALPIILQNALTNFVSLLDNMMIGALGTESMSGAAIVNQILLIFNLAVFGGMSGIGIFSAQYFGSGDQRGVRHTFRFKLLAALLISAVGAAVLFFFSEGLIGLYLHEDGSGADLALTLSEGKAYLFVILIGLIPFALTQAYGSTLREGGEALVPMLSGSVAIAVNLVLNYVLIYGKLGAPALGVVGAAIATVAARFVECAVIVVYAHTHTRRWSFLVGAYRSLAVPRALIPKILRRALPLLANEALWAFGIAMISRSYSLRGISAVAANNIASTLTNLTNVICIGIGCAVSIIVGQHLGAGRLDDARRDAWRMATLSVASCLIFGTLTVILAPYFPRLYETEEEVRSIAAGLIRISGYFMPVTAFLNAAYFIIRSGGKTLLTTVFDSGFLLVVSLPAAYLFVTLTDLSLITIYALVLSLDAIKATIGFFMVKSGVWVSNIIKDDRT